MPLLNFRKQFAPLIESGKKRQTIRACRADGRNPRVNQTLYLYTGLRHKSARKLGEETCRQSWPVFMDEQDDGRIDVFISGELLGPDRWSDWL